METTSTVRVIGLTIEEKLTIFKEIGSVYNKDDKEKNECALHLLSCLHEIIGMGPCPKEWTVIYHLENLVRLCQNDVLKERILNTLPSMVKTETDRVHATYPFYNILWISKFIHDKCGMPSK
jgi:hypothetical protein